VEKTIRFAQGQLGLRVDAYNLFNVDTVTSKRTRTTSAGNFGEPLAFVGGRSLRLSARFTF
jgi:outer membrane receptor protein involved in Fe transport